MAEAHAPQDRPRLIFFTELAASQLDDLLDTADVAERLRAMGSAIALPIRVLDDPTAAMVRRLACMGLDVVAWLMLSESEGETFNLENYPQAASFYQAFHRWAQQQRLQFVAIGLDIAHSPEEFDHADPLSVRELVRRIWLARDNVLYQPARVAYRDLVAAMHRDGYEVHAYQGPLIADDRRAGTTLLQRALDIVEVPADIEVLMCSSITPLEEFGYDFGGALIASYGTSADAIGISGSSQARGINWRSLRRDLLLAAHQTDTIYLYALEHVVHAGLLAHIQTLDWRAEARPTWAMRGFVGVVRFVLLLVLLSIRFGRTIIAWFGWVLALILWLQLRRRR